MYFRAIHRGLLLLTLFGVGCAVEKAEGRPWIHGLKLTGAKSISQRDLKSKISVQKTSWIPLSPKHYLDAFAVPADRERIEAYYHAHGYFDAKVTAAEIKYRKNKKSVDLEFKIDEGTPTKIVKVEILGADKLGKTSHTIVARTKLKADQILVYDAYEAEKKRIEHVLQMHGFAWSEVTGEVQVDRAARTAVVTINVDPGAWAHFGKVIVEGNDKVRAIDIERIADLHQGRPFDPSVVEEARGHVYGVGVFGSVKLSYEHDPADPKIANIRIQVKESKFNELRLGGGVGIEAERNDVHATAQYTMRNFHGGLRTLQLRLEPAYVVAPALWTTGADRRHGPAGTAEAIFTQPFLFGLRHFEFRLTGGYDLGIDLAYQFHGPRTQLALNYGVWRQRLQFGLSYNFQFLQFFDTVASNLADPDQAGAVYGYTPLYRLGWFQQDIALDLRDKALDTHYGVYLLASFEEGGTYAGGAFTYEKIVPDGRFYAPLGSHITFATRVQFGQIFTPAKSAASDELGSPITRRLYLGGPSSHRGFNYNRLSYQVKSGYSGVAPIPIGGDESILIQGELRFKIAKIFGNWFGAVVFADGGDVSLPRCIKTDPMATTKPLPQDCPAALANALTRIDMTKLHWAVGAGLRYKTIIGTVRFDVGMRLNRLEDTTDGIPNPDPGTNLANRFAYHLSVGEAF